MKMLGKIDTWLALWFASYVCNTLAVSHTPCSGVFLHTCMWAALYMALRSLPVEHIGKRHWAYLCACLGLWQAGMGVGQLLGVCASGHYLYAVTGSFFHPSAAGRIESCGCFGEWVHFTPLGAFVKSSVLWGIALFCVVAGRKKLLNYQS